MKETRMMYMLLICGEEQPEIAADEREEGSDVEPWLKEVTGRGARLFGARLGDPSDATTVRKRNGQVLLSDGPYAETKEWIAGFDLIECENLDEAIEIAAAHPVAELGMIEVRPLHPDAARWLQSYPGSGA
jgi:hypothetical protein